MTDIEKYLFDLQGYLILEDVLAPEELAELACFLLSERSSFMTGQTIVASGGRVTLP